MATAENPDQRNNGPLLLVHRERASSSDENPNLVLNQGNLDGLLKQVGDRPLSIYCVSGPREAGKLLLFGYMVKYLTAAENDNADWIDWSASGRNTPLTEFQWSSSDAGKNKSPHYSGIWSFNRPFILMSGGEKEVAVLLLYVQSSEKVHWTNDDSPMMGLAMVASCCTILNVQKQLDEKCISSVAHQVTSAILHGGNGGHLGDAMFVIRDWNFPTEYPYGIPGGEKFIREEKLRAKPHHSKEARLSRELINSKFQTVSGCLLPFPGVKVLQSEFKGSVGEMEKVFGEKLEHFISEAINLEELMLKRDEHGNVIGGQQWKALLERYINRVNAGGEAANEMNNRRVLRAVGLNGATLKEEQKGMMKMAMKVYGDAWKGGLKNLRGDVKERDLKEQHRLAKKKALETFKKSVGSDDEDDDDEEDVEEYLKMRLDERFQEIKREYGKKQEAALEKWTGEMIEQYETVMTEAFPLHGHPIPSKTSVLRESQEIISSLLEEFEKKKGRGLEDFQERLKAAEAKFLTRIFKRRGSGDGHEAQGPPDSDDSGRNSTSSMKWTPSNNMGSLETVACATPTVVEPFSSFRQEESCSKRSMFETSIGDFGGFNGSFMGARSSRASDKKMEDERKKKLAMSLIDRLKESYANGLKRGNVDDDEEWRKVQGEFSKEVSFPVGTTEFDFYWELLEGEMKMIQASVNVQRKKTTKSRQAVLTQAVQEGLATYQSKLEKFLKQGRVTPGQLEVESKKYLKEELDKISGKFSGQDISTLKGELEKKIGEVFEKARKDIEDNLVMSVQRSMNLVESCRREYMNIMNESMTCVETEEQLEREHEKASSKAVLNFKGNPQFTEDHVHRLEVWLGQAFLQLKAKFQVKMSGESVSSRLDVSNARAFYCAEMEKHLKNHDFVSSVELAKIDQEVAQIALDKLQGTDEGQRGELKEKLKVAFKRFEDENNMKMEGEPIIGIDLGTTFSCTAVFQSGELKIIPNELGKYTTPSYVLYQTSGEEVVGEEAKKRAYENPEGTIFDAKRILGRSFDDVELQSDMELWPFNVVDGGRGVPMIEVNGRRRYPEEISAKILAQLKKDAEVYLKRNVTKAVITVPAYFTDGQKEATIAAARMAGLKVVANLKEPVAAAMAYKLQYASDNERHILIFDLGGGTFDVAVLKTTKGEIEVLNSEGEMHLGGVDFDKNLMTYCAEEFKKQHGIDLFRGKDSPIKIVRDDVRRQLNRLQGECERQKIMLSEGRSAEVSVQRIHKELELSVKINRTTFERINEEHFEKTIQVVEKALRNAGVEKRQIDDIVLVGGSTRIPKVQKLLQNYFDGKKLDYKINPDEAVARGAGLFAAIRKGDVGKDSAAFTKIQDVTAMPIGVEVYGGGFSEIIPKSTKFPLKLQEQYKTAHNNQTSVQITIYEGEDPVAVNNKKLGDFYLNNIPPKGAGEENIDVEMVINDQGVLHVTAKCSSTGKSSKKTITVTENKQRIGEAAIKRYLAEAEAVELANVAAA